MTGVSEVSHTLPQVNIVHARLRPPWANRYLVLHDGRLIADVNVVAKWRRVVGVLAAAGFDVRVHTSRLLTPKAVKTTTGWEGAPHGEASPRSPLDVQPLSQRGRLLARGLAVVGTALGALGLWVAMVSTPIPTASASTIDLVAAWTVGVFIGAAVGWRQAGSIRRGTGITISRSVGSLITVGLLCLFVFMVFESSTNRWLLPTFESAVLACFAGVLTLGALRFVRR